SDWKRRAGRAKQTNRSTIRRLRVSLVWRHFQVIEINPKLGVGENAGTALLVGNRIDAVDWPRFGLSFAGGPGLTANSRLAIGLVFHSQLEVVPDVRLPVELGGDGPRSLGLPGVQLQPLVVAEGHQRVALRDDPGVAHLAPLLVDANVGLNRVVR